MARAPVPFTLLACGLTVASACTSAPDGGGGSGGGTPSGAATGAGGAATGGATASGGASSGGTSSGGAGSGGAGSGGEVNDGSGGLAGGTASGGSESTGGTDGSGGAEGSPPGYGPCDSDEGAEGNPACVEGELCVQNTCSEVCPTELEEALAHECPESPGGEAMSVCSFALGRCYLLCETQGGPVYTCPEGMECNLGQCSWP